MELLMLSLEVATTVLDLVLCVLFLHILLARVCKMQLRSVLWVAVVTVLCIAIDHMGCPFLVKSAIFTVSGVLYAKYIMRLGLGLSLLLPSMFITLVFVCEFAVMGLAKTVFDGALLVQLEQTVPYQIFCMVVSRALLFAIVGLLLLLARYKGRGVNTSGLSRPYWIVLLSVVGGFGSIVGLLGFSLTLRPQMLEQVLHWLAGLFACILVAFFVLLLRISRETERQFNLEAELRQAETQLRQQDALQSMHEQLRGLRHDYHNHMQVVSSLAEQGRLEELHAYIGELSASSAQGQDAVSTGNPYVDAVLNAKLLVAASRGITVKTDIYFPDTMRVAPSDLCSVLFNLLDNATEACSRNEQAAHKCIHLTLRQQKGFLRIACHNPTEHTPVQERGAFKSSKDGGLHGVGLRRLRRIAEAYEGLFEAEYEAGEFHARMLLPNEVEIGRFYAARVSVGPEKPVEVAR